MTAELAIVSQDPQELQKLIDEYFESRRGTRRVYPRNGEPFEEEWLRPPTFTGLALSVGVSRMTLWRYVHRRVEVPDDVLLVLTRASERLQEMVEEAMFHRETYQGARFSLEVNFRHGKEDEDQGSGGGFHETVIAPAGDGDQQLAIPKWDDEDDD